jgi:hypothetical protein
MVVASGWTKARDVFKGAVDCGAAFTNMTLRGAESSGDGVDCGQFLDTVPLVLTDGSDHMWGEPPMLDPI